MDRRPPLLYLVHRIPYPPNKGDKVRSFNILRQLARTHRVFLGTFVDIAEDRQYIPRLTEWCTDVLAIDLDPRLAKIASLRGLATSEALSVPYYRSGRLERWVRRIVEEHGIRQAVAFSGPMAQYLDVPGLTTRIIDFCDVDSAKWAQYATSMRWPMSWLYRREATLLQAFERRMAARADVSTFVTEAEANLFRSAAPEVSDRVLSVPNGVDAGYFSPDHHLANPYPAGGPTIVFTGAMDYWPNVDGVSWFVESVLPGIRRIRPDARFYIVGMNPAPAVQALAGESVVVTGSVTDIRPYLRYADVVVAPLRVARGIQNKVLEAMSMARPVVVSAAAAAGLGGESGKDYLVATHPEDFVERIDEVLAEGDQRVEIGRRARECVLKDYSWAAHLSVFDRLLMSDLPENAMARTVSIEGVGA